MFSEPTKQRAQRIDLDHHRRPDALSRAKWWLSLLAIVATTAYAAWITWPVPARETAFSPGDVAAAHAAWNHRCAECHEPFTAVRSDAWQASDPHHRELADKKCQACHAMPSHQPQLANESSCAACHIEHRGTDASLVRIDDAHCVRCHSSLPVPPGQKASRFARVITAFYSASAETHPKFRSLEYDPRRLKFNHALHMTPGIPKETSPGQISLKKFADLSKNYRQSWLPPVADGKESGDVQLDCAACHRPDESGAYMQPIAFENHCRECHPLNLNADPKSEVPHGLPPDRLRAAVAGALNMPATESTDPVVRYEKLFAKPDALAARNPKTLEQQLQQADSLLTSNDRCLKCHELVQEESVFRSPVVKVDVPRRWFQHARFDHAAHATVDCKRCHAAAFEPKPKDEPLKHDRPTPMIANYAVCAECHRPADGLPATTERFAGTRSDCVECHSYHDENMAKAHGVMSLANPADGEP